MKEEHLHFIWKFQLFDKSNLHSSYGEKIDILHLGTHNFNQGPDFLNASVRIGNEILHGNIEIHIQNEDWYVHRHERDSNYDNVILHVVHETTREIYTLTSQKTLIPILVLSERIDPVILENLDYLMSQKSTIACADILKMPLDIHISQFKQKIFAERIIRKSAWIKELIAQNTNDYESSFYQAMLYGFGLKTNAESFLQLAQSLPQKYLAKNIDDRFKLEALLLGQANAIEVCDDYSKRLYEEYQYLQKLYHLTPIPSSPLFAKMLPASFPTLRLAQFAGFIFKRKGLYEALTSFHTLEEIRDYFRFDVSDYWISHYRFGNVSNKKANHISDAFIEKIIINVILPFLFLIEIERDNDPSRSIELYQSLAAENNKITREMTVTIPLEIKSAFDSQSIIEWHQNYCTKKNCLNCPIGFYTLKSS